MNGQDRSCITGHALSVVVVMHSPHLSLYIRLFLEPFLKRLGLPKAIFWQVHANKINIQGISVAITDKVMDEGEGKAKEKFLTLLRDILDMLSDNQSTDFFLAFLGGVLELLFIVMFLVFVNPTIL